MRVKLDIQVIIPVFELDIKNGREVVRKGADKVLDNIKSKHSAGQDALGRPFGDDRTFNDTGQMIESIHVQQGKAKNPTATVKTKGTHKTNRVKNDVLLKIHAAPRSEKKPYDPALFLVADKDLRTEVKTEGAKALDVALKDTGKERIVKLA